MGGGLTLWCQVSIAGLLELIVFLPVITVQYLGKYLTVFRWRDIVLKQHLAKNYAHIIF
jgi:hypothetical protein